MWLTRLAALAMLDPADRALVYPTGSSKVLTPLSSRQGSPDFTNLFVRQLGERVLFPSYTSPVLQAVGHVAGMITEIEVIRPIVSRIVVTMADELVAVELPAQYGGHYGAVEHDSSPRGIPYVLCLDGLGAMT